MTQSSLYLGIDGGGTKTLCWLGELTDGTLRVLGVGQGGASNPRAVGFDQALVNLHSSVLLAFQQANLSPRIAQQLVMCVAGAGRTEEQNRLIEWSSQSAIADHSRVISEAEAVLAAASSNATDQPLNSDESCSIRSISINQGRAGRVTEASEVQAHLALICGTGSLAWGSLVGMPPDNAPPRNSESLVSAAQVSPVTTARSGGWGYLLGDEGSGFWIGQKLLQVACRAADGRPTEHPVAAQDLLKVLLENLRCGSPGELIGWCYADTGSRQRIAGLASLAFQLRGNAAVDAIIEAAAKELSAMVASTLVKLDATKFNLAFAGSIAVHQPSFRGQVVHFLELEGCIPQKIHCVPQPVLGCLVLAAKDEGCQ